jgi:LCP family protein required for cell wall assembly
MPGKMEALTLKPGASEDYTRRLVTYQGSVYLPGEHAGVPKITRHVTPLLPLPALEELTSEQPTAPQAEALSMPAHSIEQFPTVPLKQSTPPRAKQAPERSIERFPTVLLGETIRLPRRAAIPATQVTGPVRRPPVKRRPVPKQPEWFGEKLLERLLLPGSGRGSRQFPRKTRLKKRLPFRLWPKKLLAIGALVLLIVGGCIYGLTLLENWIVNPLNQFFRPLTGESYNSLDGRSWNLLLLGSDDDNKFVFPELLTQVMMVVHVDPSNESIALVSIPRDSWVSVPGQPGMHKIDQAFYLGSVAHHSFDDGVRLASATIERDYGISIDRYAWIGLDGFASVINTLGGVDIDVTHPLLDDNYPDDTTTSAHHKHDRYAVKRIYLAPGPQHLTGEQALDYVRSRHADLVGDIGRMQRQQQVLTALKQKLNLPMIFPHLAALFKDLSGKVYTDMDQSEMLSFANFIRDLPPTAIQQVTLGPGMGQQDYGRLAQIKGPGLDDVQDVILPDCETIQPVINLIFGLGDTPSCQVNGP